MAIYLPNTTTPKKGLNYVWSWLGSSLKNFAAALQPYLGGGESYKKYVALFDSSFNQTVLENTLGQDIVWTYDGVGVYIGTAVGLFPIANEAKIPVNCSQTANSALGFTVAYRNNNDTVYVETYNTSFAAANDILSNSMVEIRIYL